MLIKRDAKVDPVFCLRCGRKLLRHEEASGFYDPYSGEPKVRTMIECPERVRLKSIRDGAMLAASELPWWRVTGRSYDSAMAEGEDWVWHTAAEAQDV